MAQLTSGLTAVEKLAYQAAFEKYDKNDSGTIDEGELSCILEEQAGIKPNHEEIHELKDEWMGHMHSGEDIRSDDFLQMMEAVCPAEPTRGSGSSVSGQLLPLYSSHNLH